MARKISAGTFDRLAEKMPSIKKIVVQIEDEEFVVEVKQTLSPDEKAALVKDMVDLYERTNQRVSFIVVYYIALVKALTDIEFDYEITKQVGLFNLLSEYGIVRQILDVVPERVIDNINEMIQALEKAQKAQIKEEEDKKAKEADEPASYLKGVEGEGI